MPVSLTIYPKDKLLIEPIVAYLVEKTGGCEYEDLREEDFPGLTGVVPKSSRPYAKAYFAEFSDAMKAWKELEELFGKFEYHIEALDENELNQLQKQEFEPVKVGIILVKPADKETPEEATSNNIVITIEGFGAFGTGHHPTTRACLKFLQKYAKESSSFLDIGTGSGILSIAAEKLGIKDVLATEIDKSCIFSLAENLKENKSSVKVIICEGTKAIREDKKFDLGAANILWSVLKKLIPDLKNRVKKLIVSGILEEEVSEFKKEWGKFVVEEENSAMWYSAVLEFTK